MVLKKQISLKVKKKELCRVVNECIDDILSDAIMRDFFEYISIPHVLKDNKCLDVYKYVVEIITMIHLQIIFD